MSCKVVYLPWIPPEITAAVFRERVNARLNEPAECTYEEFLDRQARWDSFMFWRKRLPLVVNMLLWHSTKGHAHHCLEYYPEDLTMACESNSCSCTNIYSINIALRRLFATVHVDSLRALAKGIEQDTLLIQTYLNSSKNNPSKSCQMKMKLEGIKSRVICNHQASSFHMPCAAKIIRVLHLVSLVFEKVPGVDLKHNPYHFHKNKLDGIKTRLIGVFSEILEICSTHLNANDFGRNELQGDLTKRRRLNPEVDTMTISQGPEHILKTLVPMMASECHHIQSLITIVQEKGLYSKSLATHIVQPFQKGSSERASVIAALREEGHIPSERSIWRQLKWCETPLDFSDEGRPIIDQRWIKTGRRKDSGCRNNCWKGTIYMDLYPMEMKVVNMRNSDDAMSPIITMDLFSTAKRVDVCDYLQIQKHTRLYFCPKQFRVPFNLDNAWDSDSFRRLKWFIEHSSAQGNSAVKCDDRGKRKK